MKPVLKNLANLVLILVFSIVLAACGNKLTNDNLNKVKNGMTETEVKAILGKPDNVENSEILGLRNVSYLYKSGDTRVNINFINNSVISKHGSFK